MSTTADGATHTDLLDGFEGGIEPVRTSLLYRLGLLAVTLAVVMLPLIYVGLVVAVGYGLWYHAIHNATIFDGAGSARGKVFIYIAPLIVGATLLLFMVKPLFAGRPKRAEPRRLDPEAEPVLFAFVDRLCRAVHAPTPSRINVDCEVNASASFRRGLGGFVGSDLVLTIGLPLVAGLSLRELAGVLAHEFGHFSQGAGMRLSYVIRSVNLWFSRVVYERDAWDLRLERWSKGIDIRLGVILYVARFFVWLTRKILHGLMLVGHAISCFMLRQMEFDADRHEARLAGSETFASTMLNIQLLGIATRQSWADLQEAWSERRLADDLPALIRARFDRIAEQDAAAVRESIAGLKTGVFDTHPCDADRVESTTREGATGVFRLESPASALFRDFEQLSAELTREQYRAMLGEPVDESVLEPSLNFVQDRDRHRDKLTAVGDYLCGAAVWQRPVYWPAASVEPGDEEALRAGLIAARQVMQDGAAAAKQNADAWCEADRRELHAGRAAALMEAGFQIEAKSFGLAHSGIDGALNARSGARESQAGLDTALRGFGEAAERRLGLALAAARRSPPDRSPADEPSLDSLLAALDVLKGAAVEVDELRRGMDAISILFENLDGNEDQAPLINEIRQRGVDVHRQAEGLRARMGAVAHPFGTGSLADHILGPPVVDEANVADVCNAAQGAVERTQTLYFKILGHLVATALAVEGALGLEPLAGGAGS